MKIGSLNSVLILRNVYLTVQHECIPQAVLGMDILCQAKSGMGKTAVFVLATLQQLEPTENNVYVLVMCHTRELAFQISKEYERFSKYMPTIKVSSCHTLVNDVISLFNVRFFISVLLGGSVLWWYAHPEGRRNSQEHKSAHCRWNTRPDTGAHPQ